MGYKADEKLRVSEGQEGVCGTHVEHVWIAGGKEEEFEEILEYLVSRVWRKIKVDMFDFLGQLTHT